MKKLLLLGAVFFGSYFNATAQANCLMAVSLTGNETIAAPAITGTYPTGGTICTFPDSELSPAANRKALWYKFTPTSSGLLTIDSGIAPNVATGATATDTRLRLLGGTCGTFTCLAQSDDIAYPTDVRSRISNFVVTANTTYYIVWDNRWGAGAFSFQTTFTPQSCFLPTNFQYVAATTTSVTIGWTAPAAGTTPVGYQVEYGIEGFTPGTGTIGNPTTNSFQFPVNQNTIYQFRIRTNCGGFGDYSSWSNLISFAPPFTATAVPYNTSFEEDNLSFVGWGDITAQAVPEFWDVNVSTAGNPTVQDGTNSAFTFSPTTGTADAWLVSRGVNLAANQLVTVSYWVRNFIGTGGTSNNITYEVRRGTTQTVAGQSTIVYTETGLAPATAFVQKTHTFTPTAAGVYFISFHYTGGANPSQAMLLDNVSITQGTAGLNEVFASQFAVFPNPATNAITVSAADALLNGIELIDLNGRTVKTVKVGNVAETEINISDLSAGVYMMNISSDKGMTTKKIVKQ